jgi:aspartyl aminopeptidase
MYIANQNILTVDLGVPVLSMHAPMEVIAKNDLYEAHKSFCAFCK